MKEGRAILRRRDVQSEEVEQAEKVEQVGQEEVEQVAQGKAGPKALTLTLRLTHICGRGFGFFYTNDKSAAG